MLNCMWSPLCIWTFHLHKRSPLWLTKPIWIRYYLESVLSSVVRQLPFFMYPLSRSKTLDINSLSLHITLESEHHWGAWVAQLVNCLTWFHLSSWPQGHEFEPYMRLYAGLGVCLRFCLSLCPPISTALPLFLKKKKRKRISSSPFYKSESQGSEWLFKVAEQGFGSASIKTPNLDSFLSYHIISQLYIFKIYIDILLKCFVQCITCFLLTFLWNNFQPPMFFKV